MSALGGRIYQLVAEIPQLLGQMLVPGERARLRLVAFHEVFPRHALEARMERDVASRGRSLSQMTMWCDETEVKIRKYFSCVVS